MAEKKCDACGGDLHSNRDIYCNTNIQHTSKVQRYKMLGFGKAKIVEIDEEIENSTHKPTKTTHKSIGNQFSAFYEEKMNVLNETTSIENLANFMKGPNSGKCHSKKLRFGIFSENPQYRSITYMGYCIATLSDPKKRTNHIPYRDSKLTKLLADSLAGNGATLMIACISPAKSNACETVNTLRYAARAKEIRTKPVVLMDPREALILSLKREIEVLQNENKHLRSALHIYSSSTPSSGEQSPLKTPPHVDFADLGNLEWNELTELVRLYVKENAELRKKNNEFFTSREQLQRDHELVCRENERLSKKLEEIQAT